MKLFRIFAIAAMAMLASASAHAGVVALSNMGTDGVTYAPTKFVTSTNQTTAVRSAVGFTVGASGFTVETISAALFGVTPPSSLSSKVAIYSNVSGNPGVKVSESALLSNIQGDDVYSFDFTTSAGRVLAAGNTYWALIDTTGGDLAWYEHDDGIQPSDVNTTGLLTYVGDRRSLNFSDATPTWSVRTDYRTFSISGTGGLPPVPEPALTSLLCFGGIALIRRRMK